MNHLRIYFLLHIYVYLIYALPIDKDNNGGLLSKFDYYFDEVYNFIKRMAKTILNPSDAKMDETIGETIQEFGEKMAEGPHLMTTFTIPKSLGKR